MIRVQKKRKKRERKRDERGKFDREAPMTLYTCTYKCARGKMKEISPTSTGSTGNRSGTKKTAEGLSFLPCGFENTKKKAKKGKKNI